MAKYDYQDYQKHITLLDGIDDIMPYFVTLPDAPKPEKITNFGKSKETQYFLREHIPTKVKNIDYKFKSGVITRDEAVTLSEKDPEIAAFIEDQWDKRLNGTFQYINGIPMHITGFNWFYLNYFPIDIGLPHFRLTDRNYWYWRKFCVWDDPLVYGGVNFTLRRGGKSAAAGCEAVEVTTRVRNKLSGMQSKTDTDAKRLFNKFVYYQFSKLPYYFQPIYDPNNKSEIRMDEYRGFDSEEKPISSLIDYRASTDTAYDSEKLLVGIIDEAGKMKDPVNPIDIWDKMKPCFKEEDAIVGKCIMTTTVEEMEKGGGKKFKKIWQDSSRNPKHGKLDEFGTPISGLIQYFTPATYSYVFDQYGFSIVGDPTPSQQKFRYDQLIKRGESEAVSEKKSRMGAVELLEYERKSKRTEEDRNDHRRKYPFSIKEAFTSAYKSCHFSLEKINAQEEKFLYGNPYKLVKGNFVWKDSIPDTTVVFQPSETGKFLVSYLLPQEQSNAQDLLNGKRVPLNVMKGGAGCDPYKFSTHAQSSDPSLGAGYIWWGYDESIDGELPDNEQVTDNFIVEYINRPKSREIFNEDMLMMCVYYGIKINIEVNVEHTMNYFIDRGYEGYLLFGRFAKKEGRKLVIREKDKAGQYSTGDKVKDPMFAHFEWYVENKLTQCKFPRLLEQIREVEYEDTRKYDAFMGAGYCLLGIKMINKKPSIKKEGYSSPLSVHQAAEF